MAKTAQPAAVEADSSEPEKGEAEKGARRQIPGGLPYTSSAGVLKKVLQKIPNSEKPAVFNPDFLATVMETTGGSSRPVIPILKTAGLLNQSGAPTELYAQYQTEAGRPAAALQALKNGFAEVFRRNQYAHKADENALTDIIVQITGLPRKDPIVRYMLNTFQAFQETARNASEGQPKKDAEDSDKDKLAPLPSAGTVPGRVQLAYNINVVLPETTNVEVYNAIFRSLKGNLLS